MNEDRKINGITSNISQAHLLDLVDGPDRPALYVPDHAGNPKFWIKTEPRVYLVGHTGLEFGCDDQPGLDAFFQDEGLEMPGPEQRSMAGDKGTIVETAGRLCYYSFKKPRPGGHLAYMNRIIEEGHGSVLEHAHFNFIITGVSRTFSHELVRHRLASYSQLSQRYFDETECAFVCPPKTARNASFFERWIETMECCYDSYIEQVESMKDSGAFDDLEGRDRHKAILGEARSQLPNATETKLMFSCNARCLRGVLDQRGAAAADQEIRRVAIQLYELAHAEFPTGFDDYVRSEIPGYGRTISSPHPKV